VVPRVVLDKSPLRAAARELPGDDLGDLSVGVCAERRKTKVAVVKAFWDSV
jgi:hypothetical protein